MLNKEQFLSEYGTIQYHMTRLKELHSFAETQRGENFVLSFLLRCEKDVNPKEICSALNVSSARIAAILKKLEKQNMIERYQDTSNHRQVLVRILPNGVVRHKEIQENFRIGAAELYEALGEDASTFLALQNKILEYYKQKKE